MGPAQLSAPDLGQFPPAKFPTFFVKTSFLKRLDYVLSGPACAAVSLLPKKKRTPLAPVSTEVAQGAEILIIRPGGMGDLIHADLAWQAISKEEKDAKKWRVTWLIERRAEPWAVYRNLDYRCYDRSPLATLGNLRNRFDLVVNTEQRFGLAQVYALWGKLSDGEIISWKTNRQALWSTRTVAYDWRDEREVLAFARLFACAQKKNLARSLSFRQALINRTRERPPRLPPLLYLAGRQSRSRRLSVDAWSHLVRLWLLDLSRSTPDGEPHGAASSEPASVPPLRFNLAAGPLDQALAQGLKDRFPGQAELLSGSFGQLCDQLAESRCVLTIDGGALHVASYFGVPTWAVFTSGRELKWRPLARGSRVLRREDLPCRPCTQFGQVPPCPYRYACLQIAGQMFKPMEVLPVADSVG